LKIIFRFFFILFILFGNILVQADDRQVQMQKQIEEVMKARDQILKSLIDDSDFQDMSSRMEKLMKSFDNDDFFSGSDDVVGEYDWKETKTYQILSLKVKQIKDRPLDIKIKEGKVTIKGDVESQSTSKTQKKITRVHFERVFSIPPGVDETNPEFENKKGELLIKFKKKITVAPKKDLIPIVPTPNDQTI
jgi:HSP20 family molecular chaperone IbpA